MICDPHHPETWFRFRPLFIAHDVARSRDHSTAVVGGIGPFEPPRIGIVEARELPQQIFGHARASALAEVDRRYDSNGLILADLSQDPSYAEALYETFGNRVIGLHITRYGDGQTAERRPVGHGSMLVYTIGRTYLFDLLLAQFQASQVRLSQSADVRRAFEQLALLEIEQRETGFIYTCANGQHDDLAISMAMIAWAVGHPHSRSWANALERRQRKPREKISWAAWT